MKLNWAKKGVIIMKTHITLKISGMTCASCSERIRREVSKLSVEELQVSYTKGNLICLTDDVENIISVIDKLGYNAMVSEASRENKAYLRVIVGIAIFLGFYMIIKSTIGFNSIPALQEGAGYSILFLLGLITSLHCLSMCGGIVLSQSIAFNNPIKSSILYNIGRVLAYTMVGGIVGGLGAVISFTPQLKGYITIFAGGFMILLGLSMLDTFQFLKRYIRLPGLFNLSRYKGKSNTPFFIGLATGLMPCGPLQTMQLYALGTGSVFKGALSMFIFSIGTVPLMMGLGTLSGYISSGLNRKLMKVSAVLVMFLGLIIVNRGLVLQGKVPLNQLISTKQTMSEVKLPEIINGFQSITTYANNNGYEPNYFIIEKGKTVKWVIRGEAVNGCNNEIVIPALNVRKKIEEGFNLIEFTPEDVGDIVFSCWMGMLDGKFIVVDDINNIPDNIKAIPTERAACCSGT